MKTRWLFGAALALLTIICVCMIAVPGRTQQGLIYDLTGGNALIRGQLDVLGDADVDSLSMAGYSVQVAEASADITDDTAITIEVGVPDNARLIAAQLRVDEALASGESWDAEYKTGASQSIASDASEDQNTKVSTWFDVNAATDITSDETDIKIERHSDPGVDTFTAQGSISAIVYYAVLEDMDDV